ncbi:MAG TPA: GNAT family protein [Marmoricola sp.]|nr:GNAT family protein [Marmoricola sp.]
MSRINEFNQPIGREVDWTTARTPQSREFIGQSVRLEPLRREHATELFDALGHAPTMWTYLPTDPPLSVSDMVAIIDSLLAPSDHLAFLVRAANGSAQGTLSYCAIQPEIGTIEVGWVAFGPTLQRTRTSTEAQFLLMKHAFEDLGYRRYEWKCDSLNAASRAAASRLGFVEEGTWRNARVIKGRNRDTTWFSITDDEWPAAESAFVAWLADDNFDRHGQQRSSLSSLR